MGEAVPNESPRSEGLALTAANFTWHCRTAAEHDLATNRHASVSIRGRCPLSGGPRHFTQGQGWYQGFHIAHPQGEHLILTRRKGLLNLTLPDLQVLNTVLTVLSCLSHLRKRAISYEETHWHDSRGLFSYPLFYLWLIATFQDSSSKTLHAPPEEC